MSVRNLALTFTAPIGGAALYMVMDREDLTLIFAALAVVVTILYGEIERRGRRKQEELARRHHQEQQEVAQKQLKLATEQTERPILEINMSLLELRNIEALTKTVRKQIGAVRRAKYTGPPPDKIVQVNVANSGKVAAYEVTGWLTFDAAYWEPLPYFTGDVEIDEIHFIGDVSDGLARKRVQVGGQDSILRATPNDSLSFFVALSVHSSGRTKIFYDFTAAGEVRQKHFIEMEIPGI